MSELPINQSQLDDISALIATFDTFNHLLGQGECTPTMLHMTASIIRKAAETIEEIAVAWEQAS